MMPLITIGQVVSHAPDAGGVNVTLRTSAGAPSLPVRMLYDVVDALRVSQRPLPEIGSWGVLTFPYGNSQNGFWLGAFAPSAMSAISTFGTATDPRTDYESHWSGWWRMLDGEGQETTVFPDGSSIVIGLGTAVPVPNRFTTENNARIKVPFTQAERVPDPPTPFQVTINLANGLSILVNAAGQLSIDLPASQKLDISQGGGAPSDMLVLVSKLVTIFNAHTHKNVSAGIVNSGTPTVNIAAGDIDSTIIGISN